MPLCPAVSGGRFSPTALPTLRWASSCSCCKLLGSSWPEMTAPWRIEAGLGGWDGESLGGNRGRLIQPDWEPGSCAQLARTPACACHSTMSVPSVWAVVSVLMSTTEQGLRGPLACLCASEPWSERCSFPLLHRAEWPVLLSMVVTMEGASWDLAPGTDRHTVRDSECCYHTPAIHMRKLRLSK
jgi:hypothetical protein